jgi:hypothetical protein
VKHVSTFLFIVVEDSRAITFALTLRSELAYSPIDLPNLTSRKRQSNASATSREPPRIADKCPQVYNCLWSRPLCILAVICSVLNLADISRFAASFIPLSKLMNNNSTANIKYPTTRAVWEQHCTRILWFNFTVKSTIFLDLDRNFRELKM